MFKLKKSKMTESLIQTILKELKGRTFVDTRTNIRYTNLYLSAPKDFEPNILIFGSRVDPPPISPFDQVNFPIEDIIYFQQLSET